MPFVKLDCGMLNSSLWVDHDARTIFITALLMAEPFELSEPTQQIVVHSLDYADFVVPPGWYGFVPAASVGIIRRAGLEEEVGFKALVRLGDPDKNSRSEEFEGRRLVRVNGGFIVLNYDKYRQKDHTAAERSRRWRERKATADTRVGVDDTRIATVRNRCATQAEAEAEEEAEAKDKSSVETDVSTNKSLLLIEKKKRKEEIDWRISQVWDAHLRASNRYFLRMNGVEPSSKPTLTDQISAAIKRSLEEYDGELLGGEQREEWTTHSKARAAGIGIYLDPYMTGESEDNDRNDGGKSYLEHWRPWLRQRGKGDPVERFAELYFEVKDAHRASAGKH